MTPTSDNARQALPAPTSFSELQFTRLHQLGALFGQPWARTPLEKYLHVCEEGWVHHLEVLARARSAADFPVPTDDGVQICADGLHALVLPVGAVSVWLHRPGQPEDGQGFRFERGAADAQRLGGVQETVLPDAAFDALVDAWLCLVPIDAEGAWHDMERLFWN